MNRVALIFYCHLGSVGDQLKIRSWKCAIDNYFHKMGEYGSEIANEAEIHFVLNLFLYKIN
jgi:hypothetical protein